jgi:hypothetical protein
MEHKAEEIRNKLVAEDNKYNDVECEECGFWYYEGDVAAGIPHKCEPNIYSDEYLVDRNTALQKCLARCGTGG